MRVLNVEAVRSWLAAASLLGGDGEVHFKGLLGPVCVKVPDETGRKTNLARLLADSFASTKDGLLWINEYGIWPSSENRLVFYALRRLIGEARPLEEAPGHVFAAEDKELLSALVGVVFYFSWGALLVRGDSRLVGRISHDDYVDFYGSAHELNRIEEALRSQRYVGSGESPNGNRQQD
jgi:hypothetical protein